MKLRMLLKRLYAVLQSIIKVSSIQSIITLSFTAVTLSSLIFVSLALYGTFSDNAEKNADSSTRQIMDQVNLNLNSYLKGMIEISDLIRSNLNDETYKNRNNLTNILQVTSQIRKDIVTMAVFSDTGKLLFSNTSGSCSSNFRVSEQDWFKLAVSRPADYIFVPPHVQRIFENNRPWVVSLCRSVNFYEKGVPVTWITMVDMNSSKIEQLCSQVSLGKRGYIYIVDQAGNIIYHPQQQIIYAGLKIENIADALSKNSGSYFDDFQGERRIMTIKNISFTNWKMVGISYVDELVPNKRNLSNFVIFILFFGIAFEILASMFISSKITQPIKRLERQMKRVENGDFDINLEVNGEDEVKRLSKAFNLMVSRIRQLMNQIISEQEAKRKSEFKALQAQINPHFLYNTLDSIVWMNENKNYEGVTIMVSALAKLFRVSISKGSEIINVSDEIDHAASYLTIQKIRYKDKFNFQIEAQPEVLYQKTLKLVLQPIIENAIYHGISQLQEKGEIKIAVAIEDGNIVYRVTDNGYGIKPEVLKTILDREPASARGGGVGLKNVNERIKLCYGIEYGLEIVSELDVGTTAIIRIPLNDSGNGGRYENNK
ncbi:MAG TPA: sensor histidine kinase [Clostridia bacterium]|nr:sensor histidine kinase [Clostridia bacterium]